MKNLSPSFRILSGRLLFRTQSAQFREFNSGTASTSSNPFSVLLGDRTDVNSVKRMHALLIVCGQTDLNFQTKLLSSYGKLGRIKTARLLFDQMPTPDLFSYRVMIRWYFLNNHYSDIIRLYNHMTKCLSDHDNVVFSMVLKAITKLRDIDRGRILHCRIVKEGDADGFVLTDLVDMYAKSGEMESSRAVFERIESKSVVCWSSLIHQYVKDDCPEEALTLFNRMRYSLVEGNDYTFVSLVNACTKLGALHQGKWVHGSVIKNDIKLNSHLTTALVDMYVKCESIKDARSIFDEFCTADVVSWTAMIVGYAKSGLPKEALMLFTDKYIVDILPHSATLASVLSACSQSDNSIFGRSIHGLGVKLGLEDAGVTNALVDMYAKCNMAKDARLLFDIMPSKDIVTWNSIVNGYSNSDSPDEALHLFHQMRIQHVWPDAATVVPVLSACASLGAIKIGSSVHAYSIKEGLVSYNVRIGTALISMYAKCGDVDSARAVFDEMDEKNTVTWSAMIDGYGSQGDCSKSLALFEDMVRAKVKPSAVTFTNIISACSHTGNVREGLRYFDEMSDKYNLVPSLKHYVCIVDLLARNGRLEEAWDFIEKIPIEADVSLFGAYLHGCSLHSRFDLGEMAIKRMMELNLDDASYYVLMSNLYASDGRWNHVYEMAEFIETRDLTKSTGWSRVDTNFDTDFFDVPVASFA